MEENFDVLQVLDRLRVLKLEYLKLNIRAILKNNFECLSWILNFELNDGVKRSRFNRKHL